MNDNHDYLSVGVNTLTTDRELAVLFSGEGQPHGLHGIGPAIHDYYLIHTILSGHGQYTLRNKQYSCSTGDTFVIFPGELFSYQADEHKPWAYVWVGFANRGASSILEALGVSPEQPIIHNSLTPLIRSYYKQLHICFQSGMNSQLSDLESSGLVRLLLQQLGYCKLSVDRLDSAADMSVDHVMKQAIQILTYQFTQSISIEHLSSMLGYHRTHLCKLFKQTTGLSPMQYLLKVRMKRAEQLLATSITIDQVATSVGYSDALYFSKKFRKWKGQSPSEYRKAIKEKILAL